jgi:hypothetical protein
MTGILGDHAIGSVIGDRAALVDLRFRGLMHGAPVISGPEPEHPKVPASAGPRLLAARRRGPAVTQVISIG